MQQKKPPSEETLRRIDTDPLFVQARHANNNLATLMERYPNGMPNHLIARVLGRTEKQISAIWATVLRVLRSRMGVHKDD